MRRLLILFIVMLLAAFAVSCATGALIVWAQEYQWAPPPPPEDLDPATCRMGEFGCHHQEYHPHYATWHSDNGASCCNGHDCRPVRARRSLSGDGIEWYAPEAGKWFPVPPTAYRTRQEGDPEHAHICTNPPAYWHPDPVVYCFTAGQAER